MQKTYVVNFYDASGHCCFRKEAKHIDITAYQTIIDFSTDNQTETNVFRSFDELQLIQVIQNIFVITFISGQRITIAIC